MGAINASSILSYKPQAELAGAPVAPVADVLSRTSAIFNDIDRRQQQRNAMQYQQALKDRDASLDVFSQTNVDWDIEKEDRPKVEEQYGRIKEIMLKYNGNPMANQKGRVEMQDAVANFKRMKAISQARRKTAMEQEQQIAREMNEQRRQERIKHLEKWKADPNNIGEPFYEKPIVSENLIDERLPAPKTITRSALKNGVYYKVNESKYDFAEIDDMFTPENVLGVPGKGKQSVKQQTKDGKLTTTATTAMQEPAAGDPRLIDSFTQYAVDFWDNPLVDEDYLRSFNERLDAANKEQGLQPGMPGYEAPLQWQVDPEDGRPMPSQDLTPLDLARKVAKLKVGGVTSVSEEVDMELMKGLSQKALAEQRKASAAKSYTDAARIKAITQPTVNKLNAEADLARKRGDVEGMKLIERQKEVLEPATSVYVALDKINTDAQFKPASTWLGKLPKEAKSVINQYGITDDYDMVELSKNTPVVSKMLSRAYIEEEKGKKLPGGQLPTKVYAIRKPGGGAKDIQLIGIHKDGEIKVVDYKEGAAELIKADNDYNTGQGILDKMNTARGVMDELFVEDVEKTDTSLSAEGVPDGEYEMGGVRYRVTGGVVEEIDENEE